MYVLLEIEIELYTFEFTKKKQRDFKSFRQKDLILPRI